MRVSMPAHRISLSGAMLLIALLGLALAVLFPREPLRFQRAFQRLISDLRSLEGRKPPDVPPLVWKNAVEVTWNVSGNVFSPGRVSTDEFERFDAELEQKLQGEVGLETLDWIWERLARTPTETGRRKGTRDFVARYRALYERIVQGQRSLPPSGGMAPAPAAPPPPATGIAK
jgi:hypothetical protein